MRTTFLIDDDVYRQVKVLAAQERCTVTSLVEEALRKILDEHVAKQTESKPEPIHFHVWSSPLVDPNLDLSDNSAVLDAMDGIGADSVPTESDHVRDLVTQP